jgi:hypothetical protein
MAGAGMETMPDSETISRQELAKLQQDMQMAATSFNEMKAKVATLEAQLHPGSSVREPPKPTAHANKHNLFVAMAPRCIWVPGYFRYKHI